MQNPTIDDAIMEIAKRLQPASPDVIVHSTVHDLITNHDAQVIKYIVNKMYLFEVLNGDLGNRYIWYNAPVSGDLTALMVRNLHVLSEPTVSINDVVERDCQRINLLVGFKSDADIPDAKWFHLLASVVFLNRNNKDLDIQETSKWLRQEYDVIDIIHAYIVLENHGFFNVD